LDELASFNQLPLRGDGRIRTAVQGFADPCLATRPRHRTCCAFNELSVTLRALRVSTSIKINMCTPDRNRTCNLRFRKPLLYPVELRAQVSKDQIHKVRIKNFRSGTTRVGLPQKRIGSPREERTDFDVGVAGFEPATLCSQSRCANRAALHPELRS
jgi:hypothetical protein